MSTTTIIKRPAAERGVTDWGWLLSRHTFSFGEYDDPDHMGFRALRVINDDIVEPGRGFGRHFHRDAEIFSYVIEGALEHRDSMGHGSVVTAGNLQYMSAGNGVMHSEFNPSSTDRVHFLQVWILPNTHGGEPRYAEKKLGANTKPNALTLLLSGSPNNDAVQIRQDADVYFGSLDKGRSLEFKPGKDRHVWIHVFAGNLIVANENLVDGDGLAISPAPDLILAAAEDAKFFLFNLA